MSLPTFPGILAVPHDHVDAKIGIGTGIFAAAAQAVMVSPLLQTIVGSAAAAIASIATAEVAKHIKGHLRHRTEVRELALKHRHEADSRRIQELERLLEEARSGSGSERIEGDRP